MRIRDVLLALGVVAVGCGLVVAVTYPTPSPTPPSLPIIVPHVRQSHKQESAVKVVEVIVIKRNSLDVRLEKE